MPGIDGTQPALHTVPELAAHYLEYIQQQYHAGPYILCGHSFGGLVAFEMAHQLTAQNKEVHLMILDMAAPVYKPHHEQYQITDMVTETVGIIERLFNVSLEFNVDDTSNETVEKAFIHALKNHYILPSSTDGSYIQNLFTTQKAIHEAIDDYPTRAKPLTHALHLFKADQPRPDPIPAEIGQLYEDDYLGWQSLINNTIHCATVMGNHFSMLQDPYVQDLAKAIQTQLNQVK
jgi:thioesterase domain-containing protein